MRQGILRRDARKPQTGIPGNCYCSDEGTEHLQELKVLLGDYGATSLWAISAKSSKLAELDLRTRKLGCSTLIRDTEAYRSKGLSVDFFIAMTENEGDTPAGIRLEKIQHLAEGSPTLRFILFQIRDYVCSIQGKMEAHRK